MALCPECNANIDGENDVSLTAVSSSVDLVSCSSCGVVLGATNTL